MILDELVVHDFGVYGGRQTITLTPPAPNKPVVLFGGLNGGGKTTLLDALQLCLFGPFARCSNRNGQSYQDFLLACIHRGAGPRQAALELAFRHTVDGVERRYKLHRSWRLTASGCKEEFEVLRDGRFDRTITENWASQVEDFLPANIAHLFLFDGEKVEGYASPETSAALIGAAIQSLLGLDAVDRLERDLHTLERRKRAEAVDDRQPEMDAAEQEIRTLRSRLEHLRQEQASLRTHKLDRKRRRLAEVEEEYRRLGGELFDQRAEIERSKEAAESRAAAGERELRELAAGPLPLLLVWELLASMEARDRAEDESRRARVMLGTLEARDEALIEHLKAQRADSALLEALRRFCEEDRAKRLALGEQATHLDLPPDARADLQALLRNGLQEIAATAQALLAHQARLTEEAEHRRLEFASIPHLDIVKPLVAERDRLRAEIAQAELEYAGLQAEIERLVRDVERKQQGLARLLEVNARLRLQRDDRARILHHAVKVRGTLAMFRRAVIERHLRRIEQLVLESYRQLLRKTSLVSRLTIDPQSFDITLYGRDGHELPSDRLSAGERQLLAVALLWGLAKASGRPLPTAIDTPLGRLDASHRAHLVERYFPYASHQVLLLSTDEEITGEYLARLQPWIGRTYRLEHDDASGATRIVPGYFELREAA